MRAAIYARMSTDKQSSDSPTDQIAASEWRDLLPWATSDELRTLLDTEHAAALYARELRAAGVPERLAFEPVAFEVLAHVCVAVHGMPGALMEGRATQ